MKRFSLLVANVVLAMTLVPAAFAAEPAIAPAQVANGDPFQAVLTKAVRQVDWQRALTRTWQRAATETLLLGGDAVRTGEDAKAELLYGDGSVTRIGGLTTLQLTGDRRRELRLDAGKIWMNIKKSGAGMRIITPGAVAAVTGTELMVEFDAQKRTTEVTVFEGAVNVTGDIGDLVKVVAGTTTRVPFNAPAMAPQPLDSNKLKQRSLLYKPLSIETPGAEPTTGPAGTQSTTGSSPAPNTQTGTAVTPENPPATSAPNTSGTTGSSGGTAVQPDMKGQNETLNNPRVINGSPTRGSVRIIVE